MGGCKCLLWMEIYGYDIRSGFIGYGSIGYGVERKSVEFGQAWKN